MQSYNVVLSVPLTIDLEIDAENEEVAHRLAIDVANDDIMKALLNAECFSWEEPTLIESWELNNG